MNLWVMKVVLDNFLLLLQNKENMPINCGVELLKIVPTSYSIYTVLTMQGNMIHLLVL
jgi:hypothetical protein